jgi:hypothetical protein
MRREVAALTDDFEPVESLLYLRVGVREFADEMAHVPALDPCFGDLRPTDRDARRI